VCDADVLDAYGRDRSSFEPNASALAMVRVKDTRDVRKLANWATSHRIALVPRGAGSGVAGGACASEGCVIVNFDRMDRILEIDEAERIAVVQPGVLNVELKHAARKRDLWYPPDPASYEISTLGGQCRDECWRHVLHEIRRHRRLRAWARGGVRQRPCDPHRWPDAQGRRRYDVTRLLVGSEGTLAMITEITLRLVPFRTPLGTLRVSFDSL
jgi:glycolate oxidase